MPRKTETKIALQDAAIRTIRIVPLTVQVVAKASSTSADKSHVEVTVDGTSMSLKRCVEKECTSEYWLIRPVSVATDANMVITVFEKEVAIDDHTKMIVKIPCAVNKRSVTAGDELVLYKAAGAPTDNKEKKIVASTSCANKKPRLS